MCFLSTNSYKERTGNFFKDKDLNDRCLCHNQEVGTFTIQDRLPEKTYPHYCFLFYSLWKMPPADDSLST